MEVEHKTEVQEGSNRLRDAQVPQDPTPVNPHFKNPGSKSGETIYIFHVEQSLRVHTDGHDKGTVGGWGAITSKPDQV